MQPHDWLHAGVHDELGRWYVHRQGRLAAGTASGLPAGAPHARTPQARLASAPRRARPTSGGNTLLQGKLPH